MGFQRLSPTEVSFHRLVLLEVLLPPADEPPTDAATEAERLVQTFQRGRDPEDLREGLSFFLQAYLRPLAASSSGAGGVLPEADRATLKRSIRTARSALRPMDASAM